jgi:Tol biopolymer transport system component/DNA-binding winged helix-turn-helix (wHTH) protein
MAERAGAIDLAREPDRLCGGLTLKPRAGLMVCGARSVRIEPRLMQVLIALADAAPEVATRGELAARAWGDVVVGDDALNRCITRLRKALAEIAAPAAIETVPKLGYRLAVRADAPAVTAPPAQRPSTALILAGLAGCAVVAAAAFLGPRAAGDAAGPALGRIERLASPGVRTFDPSFAPDGARIAFSRIDAGLSEDAGLYLRDLASGAERRIDADGGAVNPAWSFDGRAIAYVRARAGAPCRIMSADVETGARREIGACRTAEVANLAWSPDGGALYFDDAPAPGAARQIMRLRLSDGEVRAVTPSPLGGGDMFAAPSPDGRTLAFLREEAWLSGHVMSLDLASGALRRLTDEASDIYGLAWDRGGKALFVSGAWEGASGLWRLDVESGARTRLTGAPGASLGGLTRGGDRLAFEVRDLRRSLVALSKEGGRTIETPLFDGMNDDADPDISPTHGGVAFVSRRSGRPALWVAMPAEQPRQIGADDADFVGGPQWSPDGRDIIVAEARDGRQDLVVYRPSDLARRQATHDAALDLAPQWIEEGRAILFASERQGGWGLWRISAEGGGAERVMAGARAGAQGADGALLYQSTDDGGFYLVRNRRTVHVGAGAPCLCARVLHANGVFYVLDRDGFDFLSIRRLEGRTLSAPLWRGRLDPKSRFAFTADGRPVVAIRTRTESQIYIGDIAASVPQRRDRG